MLSRCALHSSRCPYMHVRAVWAFTARYGLHVRQVPQGPSTLEASAASLPPRPSQLLPAGTTVAGWESHPLRERAFHGALSFRVRVAVVARVSPLLGIGSDPQPQQRAIALFQINLTLVQNLAIKREIPGGARIVGEGVIFHQPEPE